MIDPLSHVLFILASWLLYGAASQALRPWILPVIGTLFLLIYAPVAAVWIFATALEAATMFLACRKLARNSPVRKYLPYVVLPNFLFVDFHLVIFQFPFETLAVSFSTIRIFMTTKQQSPPEPSPPLLRPVCRGRLGFPRANLRHGRASKLPQAWPAWR